MAKTPTPKPAQKGASHGPLHAPAPAEPASPSSAAAPDPDAARSAFEAWRPRYLALTSVKRTRPGLDQVGLFVLARVKELAGSGLREKLARLPHELFDLANFDDLGPLASAAFHAQVQLDAAMASTSEVRVSLATVEAASAVKGRMLQVADYHLAGKSPQLAAEIADIRSGSGYTDMASDLSRLKTLYQAHLDHKDAAHLDALALVDPYYRPGDSALAGRLANTILDELTVGRTKEQQAAQDLAARAFTLLEATWDKVGTATALAADKATAARLFPSLYAAARTPRTTRKPPAPAPATAAPPPAKG